MEEEEGLACLEPRAVLDGSSETTTGGGSAPGLKGGTTVFFLYSQKQVRCNPDGVTLCCGCSCCCC